MQKRQQTIDDLIYILVKEAISVSNTGIVAVTKIKKVIFKNCVHLMILQAKINNKQEENAKDIDLVIPMYDLIECTIFSHETHINHDQIYHM